MTGSSAGSRRFRAFGWAFVVVSFGFIGAPVTFEPFLLLPIVLATLVLSVESTSKSATPGYGSIRSKRKLQPCAHMLPSKCAGIGWSWGTLSSP